MSLILEICPVHRVEGRIQIAKSPDLTHRLHTIRFMLTERDRAILDFEGSWWLYPGPKDQAIREYLDMSATRYYQALRRLVEDDEAEKTAPLTIRRLRRVREQARKRRLEQRLGDGEHG